MESVRPVRLILIAVSILMPGLTLACGELRFSAGKGLAFQHYLAPRPADVLILSSAGDADFPAGLERAGHHVTVVPDVGAMQAALTSRRFDVVIASYESADAVAASVESRGAGALTRFLPVVARRARNNADVRARFEQFVVDGASLGQYLTVINRLLPR